MSNISSIFRTKLIIGYSCVGGLVDSNYYDSQYSHNCSMI